jgi:hypothetical protein
MAAMFATTPSARVRSVRLLRACASIAVVFLASGAALAADPTPDPAEPYFRGPAPVTSVGLDLRVANDDRPAGQIGSRQPGEIVR